MKEIDLKFSDFLKDFKIFGERDWVTVYANYRNDQEETSYYCALISNKKIKESLKDPSWDLHIGQGFPSFHSYYNGDKKTIEYSRHFNEGIEPLIMRRSFYNLKKGHWEISEEFRHYFNLYEDKINNKFILIDENGDDEEAIIISDKEIKIKIRLIKEFISAKKMCLALFFDFNRFSKKTLKENNLKESCKYEKGEDFIYFIGFKKWVFDKEERKTQSFLKGKKIIFGFDNFDPDYKDKNKKFTEFIINIDENGKEIFYTCEKDKLANYFGLNEGAPYYHTPILFKKEVLCKYYSQPNKYSVEDGNLYCGGLWNLRLDNNHPDFVSVYLGDLGLLSYTEQLYWKSFNAASKGKLSHTAWSRGFEAKFTDPEKVDLYFKQKFCLFQKKWESKFGWKLFKPLHREDEHHFKSLRIPLTNESQEFDSLILSLVKVFIDSLNEKEIQKGLDITKDSKGIDKLEVFLLGKGFSFSEMMSFLRNLQELRSVGVAHRKGKKYEKIKDFFNIGRKDLLMVFEEDILVKCIWVLNTLESSFLKE